jgi:hypothetical protein
VKSNILRDCVTLGQTLAERVALVEELLDGGIASGLFGCRHTPTGCVVELDFLAGEERRELFEVGIGVGEIGYFEQAAPRPIVWH